MMSKVLLFISLVVCLGFPLSVSAGSIQDDYVDPVQELWLSEETTLEMYAQANPTKEPERFEIDNPPEKEEDTTQPLVPWLPIWGQEAREEGYDLPLPIGLSFTGLVQHQVPKIENLKFGFGDPKARPGIDLQGSKVVSATALVRADVWLFPFLNVYGFGGAIHGNADISINVRDFNLGGVPVDGFTLNIEDDYTGVTGGLGMTLAGGYKQYFGSLDANYSKAKLDFLDGKLDVTTVTARTGILVDSEKYGNGSTWLGVMYLDLYERLHGSIDVPVGPGTRRLNYDLYFTTEEKWSALAGGMWEFSKRSNAMVEVSYGGRTSILGSYNIRF